MSTSMVSKSIGLIRRVLSFPHDMSWKSRSSVGKTSLLAMAYRREPTLRTISGVVPAPGTPNKFLDWLGMPLKPFDQSLPWPTLRIKAPHLQRRLSSLWQTEYALSEGEVTGSPHWCGCVDGQIWFLRAVDGREEDVAREPVRVCAVKLVYGPGFDSLVCKVVFHSKS
jgi:hypothetical protein